MDGVAVKNKGKEENLFVKIGKAIKSLKWYEIVMC